jgi:large subunit ribosomal protein L2
VGEKILYGKDAPIQSWNRKQLKDIPEWVNVFNVEVTPFSEGKLIKSAWSYATIVGKDEATNLIFLKLSSWEVRKFNQNCRATIGEIWNDQHQNVVIGKAGRQRWLWIKPHILGKSMNPVDHPHGGWEWHTEVGLKKWPKSFSGKVVAPGIKTRKGKKWSTKFIVNKRTKN